MYTNRIIARLDIKGNNLVKGIHLEGLRVLGSPEQFANFYNSDGADELLYMDVVASLYERNSLTSLVLKTAQDIAIPLTVGGGLRSIDDINMALRAGADKIAINTAAIRSPQLITEAARRFGSSTIVVAIEAIKAPNGCYFAYTDNGREETDKDAIAWAQQAEKLGAGEILLTSVDREGTGRGFDLDLTRTVSELVSIPVIAHGGAGQVSHVEDVFKQGKADAVAVASILHYELIKRGLIDTNEPSTEGNTEFLKSRTTFGRVKSCTVKEIKKHLMESGINCRVSESEK